MSDEIEKDNESKEMLSLGSENKTMTSRQIAELTNKHHKNVLADCRKMFNELDLDSAEFSAEFISKDGRTLEEYVLDEELSITLVAKYSTKLRNAVVKEWQRLRKQRDEFLAAIQNSDPRVLQYMTDMASAKQVTETKLIEVTKQKNLAITQRAQISSSREATVMSKLAHMSPMESFNQTRIECLERATARGLINVKEIGRRVRDMLGGRLVYHPMHTQEADPNRPDHVNQALIDLGYQVEVPEHQRDTKKDVKGRKINWHNRYEVPASGFEEGSSVATHAGVVLASVASYETKYGFGVKQSLHWHPSLVKVVYEYMQRIKRDREASKAEKAEA